MDIKIVKLFTKDFLTVSEIADILNVPIYIVQTSLNRNNVKITRGCRFDEDAIFKECSEKYYILGLFSADGYIGKNNGYKFITLGLNKRDHKVFGKLKKFFKCPKKSLHLDSDNCLHFTIYSEKVHDYFASWGIGERKSLTLKLEKQIPKKYLRDFMRGSFDGDGCITGTRYADITFVLSASEEFIKQMKEMYLSLGFDLTSYTYLRKGGNNPLHHLKRCGKKGVEILEYLYTDSTIHLERKYKKFLKHKKVEEGKKIKKQISDGKKV